MDQGRRFLMDLLPYLRRYARALTGSTDRGDPLVMRLIEGTVDSIDPVSRPALYRRLHALADSTPVPAAPPSPETPRNPVEDALAALGESERRLYLLVGLESLPLSEAAEIMGLSIREAGERLAHAREVVGRSLAAVILIVEDDAIIACNLADTVRAMGHSVCGTAATREEALTLAAECSPTLALLDLHLAEGDSGIDVAGDLRRRYGLPAVFVTAFPEDLARTGAHALGPVVAKPFTREQIEEAITRAVYHLAE